MVGQAGDLCALHVLTSSSAEFSAQTVGDFSFNQNGKGLREDQILFFCLENG
ncbi:hypothetical protein OIPHN260_47840 (plasmid) [Enterobacter roggenkampii]|uniref:Uncharacterized protein n=2 Tax=Enterobacter cloacae complex TaxID=354276 RepID=A0A7I8HQ69_9ENTR|nr:hypothetical protein OIPHN260_47840 [Enterobacter roggenkampii]BCM23246.1 hypothetical protein [Enterobacter hormaechei subsp. xiangfangensis]